MDVRVPFFIFLLSNCWGANARELATTNLFRSRSGGIPSASQLNSQRPNKEVQVADGFGGNDQVCKLCEEFAVEAVNYLSNNKTQARILQILHGTCSKMHTFKQQCITLVDFYAPLFFLEISSLQPEELCQKFAICEDVVSISQSLSKNICELCHTLVSGAITKLKDPGTQLEITEVLLKACDVVQYCVKNCKGLVLVYVPMILASVVQFLETKDICAMLPACDSATATGQVLSSSETSLRAVS